MGTIQHNEETLANEVANVMYTAYCEGVGGLAYNGDPLPSWKDFAADASKQKQVDAWKKAALAALNYIKN